MFIINIFRIWSVDHWFYEADALPTDPQPLHIHILTCIFSRCVKSFLQYSLPEIVPKQQKSFTIKIDWNVKRTLNEKRKRKMEIAPSEYSIFFLQISI